MGEVALKASLAMSILTAFAMFQDGLYAHRYNVLQTQNIILRKNGAIEKKIQAKHANFVSRKNKLMEDNEAKIKAAIEERQKERKKEMEREKAMKNKSQVTPSSSNAEAKEINCEEI